MPTIINLQNLEIPGECLVFKHSTTCPVSAAAAEEVRHADTTLPVYWVNVIEQRPISNSLAEQLGVRHESPQLLLVRNGAVEKVWNHREVRRASIPSA